MWNLAPRKWTTHQAVLKLPANAIDYSFVLYSSPNGQEIEYQDRRLGFEVSGGGGDLRIPHIYGSCMSPPSIHRVNCFFPLVHQSLLHYLVRPPSIVPEIYFLWTQTCSSSSRAHSVDPQPLRRQCFHHEGRGQKLAASLWQGIHVNRLIHFPLRIRWW